MQNNIPKLPNDMIFYILKLKRLKEGEKIQKVIKNSNKSLREYCEKYADETLPYWKIAFNYCISDFYVEDRKSKYILYNIYRERYENWIVFGDDKPKKLKCPNWCKWKQKTDKEKHQLKLYKCFEELYVDLVSESGWGYYDRDELDSHINKNGKYYEGVYELVSARRVGFSKYYGYESNQRRKEEEEGKY